MKSFTLITLLAAGSALAHLQISDPFPIRTSKDPAVPEAKKDYSYSTPLEGDGGLPYPCKGYLSEDASLKTSQKSWGAGSTQAFTIAPNGANHGGGSCQLSLSYDMGKTWNVIASYIGGCMTGDYFQNSFTIPKAAPGGEAVFSWTWFNRQGQREMYQNCAIVTITNGGSGLNSRDHPAPFVANAKSVNTCSTIENQDTVFPNPGATVIYAGEYSGTTPAAGRGIMGSGCSHPGGADGAGTKGGSSSVGNGSAGDNKQLAASPSPSPSPASTTAVAAVASSATQSLSVEVPPTAAAVVKAPGATIATTNPVATTTNAAPAAAATTTTKQRHCRRRRSETAKIAKSLIPAGLEAHRVRRGARPAGWGMRRMEPEARSGRIAALPASKPVYTD